MARGRARLSAVRAGWLRSLRFWGRSLEMVLLIGSFTIGLVLALLALGVLISFRILVFRDLTVDGSFTLGGAVAAALLIAGIHPVVALGGAFVAGMSAGAVTGILHTKFNINGLLAGILVM